MPCREHSLSAKWALASGPRGYAFGQRGYVMVLSMLILLLITIMSISMAKSFFLEEGMAGNVREKARSFGAAQAALNYGEWYVSNNQGYGINCTSTGKLNNPVICNGQASVTGQSIGSTNMTNATLNSNAPLGTYFLAPTSTYLNTSGGTDQFYAQPGLYIQYVGLDVNTSGYVYCITAYGYGGNLSAVSVVQSMYVTVAATRALDGT